MSLFTRAKQVEQDLLEDAHRISEDALGWLHDLKDQLEHANTLFVKTVDDAEAEIAGHESAIRVLEARQLEAKSATQANEYTLAQVNAILPPAAVN